MRTSFYLFVALATACSSFGQNKPTPWADLNKLQAGARIQVHAAGAASHFGRFVSVSDSALAFKEMAGEQSIPKQDVLSVKLMQNKYRLRNTLIGAGLGIGLGAGIGAATHKSCSTQSFCLDIGGAAIPAAVGAVLGGLGGAVTGALWPSHHSIYEAAPPIEALHTMH